MKIEYHINNGNGKVIVTDAEGQSQQDIGTVTVDWLRSELSRVQRKYPEARVVVYGAPVSCATAVAKS